MAPRKQTHRQSLDDLYENEEVHSRCLEQRIGQLIDQRLEAATEWLTERMDGMLRAQRRSNEHQRSVDRVAPGGSMGEDLSFDDMDRLYDGSRYTRLRRQHDQMRNHRQWESRMRIDIPEFHGIVQPEELLDWLATVEEVLDFKGVPEGKRVQLVATRFRGRATAWWQQLKTTRNQLGKSKITRWEKLKKHLRATFLPYNYQRMMFQRLQNLKQGIRSVDDYTTEFYQLMARNEVQESGSN